MDHAELWKAFFVLLNQGDNVSAFQKIIPFPNICYDDILPSNIAFSGDDRISQALASIKDPHSFFRCFIHYVDATVFGSSLDLQAALSATYSSIEKEPQFQAAFPNLFVNMKTELLTCTEAKKDLKQFTQPPLCAYPCYTEQLKLLQAWYRLKEAKPDFFTYLENDSHILFRSLRYPFRYPIKMQVNQLSAAGGAAVIFMEPLEDNWETFAALWKDQPAIFVFANEAILMQMLQFVAVEDSLKEQCHTLYLLNHYPTEQLSVQEAITSLPLQAVALSDHAAVQTMLPILASNLHQAPEQLFSVARNFIAHLDSSRLGKSRAIALEARKKYLHWHDLQNRPYFQEGSIGPLPREHLNEHLVTLASQRHAKKLRQSEKLRIAHITPQLVAGGHAPTRIVTTLLTNHHRNLFDVFLIVSEVMCVHAWEHPFCEFSSESSLLRGGQVLERLASAKIPAVVLPAAKTYLENASYVNSLLRSWDIDIAIFHGPDIVNLLCAQFAYAPVRLLFEHGTLPTYPGFDVALVSMENSLKHNDKEFESLGTKGYFLPFPVDAKATWLPKPFSREALGLPHNSFIMTTISNSLKFRMSQEFCEAVAAILKMHPQAFYAPIGNIEAQVRLEFEQFFTAKGVGHQIKFLGQRSNPSQIARSMDLYLNEFPFGSCLGMLDAMASGCPVVSMFDAKGPPQARYGGEYMGMDKVIHSGRMEEYVALASRLIENRSMYEEWSLCAEHNYAERADIEGYMNKFEAILMAVAEKARQR